MQLSPSQIIIGIQNDIILSISFLNRPNFQIYSNSGNDPKTTVIIIILNEKALEYYHRLLYNFFLKGVN